MNKIIIFLIICMPAVTLYGNLSDEIVASVVFKEGRCFLVLENVGDEINVLETNIGSVLSNTFYQFPASGSLRLSDKLGEIIPMYGAQRDGWWVPSIISSSTINAEEFGKVTKISIQPKKRLEYPINIHKAVSIAVKKFVISGSPDTVKIMIPILVMDGNKSLTSGVAVSDEITIELIKDDAKK